MSPGSSCVFSCREDRARVPDDGAVHRVELVDLRRVDVDVDLHRVRAERLGGAGDPVVPARADGHDQVAVRHRLVGVGGAVHAEHAQGQRVRLGERALAQQRVGDRDLHRLRERAQLRAGARDHRAVADEEHGPLCRVQHLRRAGDLRGVPARRAPGSRGGGTPRPPAARWWRWSSPWGCRRARARACPDCAM